MSLRIAVWLLLVLTLAGCSSTQPAPGVTRTIVPETADAATSTREPAGSAGSGSISGILLDEGGVPIPDLGVFVATLTEGPTGERNIVSFSPTSSKRGTTDAQGRFVINDVPADMYSLAVWTPVSSALIPGPGEAEGEAIQLEVRAGRNTDVGTLRIKRPR